MPKIIAASNLQHMPVAELIYQTDPGVWNYLFPSKELFNRFANKLWSGTSNNFSASEAVAISSDEKIIALEMGYRGDQELALRQQMQAELLNIFNENETLALLPTSEHIDYLTAYIPADAYYLHFLSVSNKHQGKGYGAKLITNACDRARQLDCTSMHLDVYTDNPAISLYLANDFKILVETCFPNKANLPPHYRMVKSL